MSSSIGSFLDVTVGDAGAKVTIDQVLKPLNGVPLLTLEDGFEVCDKCNGHGKMTYDNQGGVFDSMLAVCPKCWGSGKLSWLEQVLGKEEPPMSDTTGVSLVGFGGGGGGGVLTHTDLNGLSGGWHGSICSAPVLADNDWSLSIREDNYHLTREEYYTLQELINERKNQKRFIDKVKKFFKRTQK